MKMEQRVFLFLGPGEAPGTHRFEIVGDRGKIVVEDEEACFPPISPIRT